LLQRLEMISRQQGGRDFPRLRRSRSQAGRSSSWMAWSVCVRNGVIAGDCSISTSISRSSEGPGNSPASSWSRALQRDGDRGRGGDGRRLTPKRQTRFRSFPKKWGYGRQRPGRVLGRCQNVDPVHAVDRIDRSRRNWRSDHCPGRLSRRVLIGPENSRYCKWKKSGSTLK
jgi:hypothetical protein